MIYTPDPKQGLEVWVDADFAGDWNLEEADDADNIYSCIGFTVYYAGCPVYWQSKLQTEIALSTAEAKYIAMLQALRETIPLATLMREMNEIFPLYLPSPKFIIKVREDNLSCIAMAKNSKFTPRAKHIAIKYHHFWKHVITQAILMGLFHLSIAPHMIKLQIPLLSLFGVIFSSSLEKIC
jgi:hypothetical protein